MAGKSLGTLTIDLIAEVGGFIKGMNQAERASEKWREKLISDSAKVGTALGAVISGISAGTIALIKSTSEHVTETDRWAKSLGISTSALMQWQYAAEKAGLSGDNIADIFKDLNDKIGDAVLNKSGEAAQALDTLGLSAKKLQSLSPDKALLAIAKAMDGMNIAQKTNIYEGLGNDLTKLMPLLNDGAEGLNKLRQASIEKGIAPSDDEISKLVAVNKIFQDWEDSFEGFRNRFAVGLAGIDLSSLTNSFQSIENTLTSPAVLQGLANMISGLGKVVDLLAASAKYANDIAYGWGKTGETTQSSTLDTLIAKRKELNDSLAYSESWYGKIDTWTGLTRSADEIRKSIAQNEALINSYQARQQGKGSGSLTTPDPKAGLENLLLGEGESNQNKKPTKPKIDHSAIKLDNSFKSTEQAYLRQISLIDTTGKKTAVVTEQQKLAFDLSTGKLNGLNSAQQERLKSLATEVDRLNQVKKANEDNLKVSEYVANLQKENSNFRQGLDADLIGAGTGDKNRDRLREIAQTKSSFSEKSDDLLKQYQAGDITKEVYDRENSAIQKSLNDRLDILKKHYKDLDDLNGDWQSGALDSIQNFMDQSNDYHQQAADAMSSILESTTDSIADGLSGILMGSESVSDAFKSMGQAMAEAVIDALTKMAAQWAVNQALQLAFGTSSVAAAAALGTSTALAWAPAAAAVSLATLGANSAPAMAGMASTSALSTSLALAGMAHDGIDSVPETGTWLLQKGERVTTAQTSAKLDSTLDRVASQSTVGSSTYAPVQHIQINGNPSDATIALVRQAAKDGADQGYRKAVNSIGTRTGDLHKVLMARTNAGVKKR